ncbi:tetratricopeptide repeat protein [Neorhodopirellula lusitana]|uniref:tetratricopeptide repeat protein n=1 Tax=Neorhodopirellula lusitana TaxID=445327 RepID=UPI00384B6880
MNPFKGKAADTSMSDSPTSLAATTGKVASNAATGSKNVFRKASSRLTGMFAGNDNDDDSQADPLSLDDQPEKLEPDVFVANGQLWESTGNLTKAMESYQRALKTSPNDEPALTSIARLHFRESNYSQAAEFFQKAIAQKPNGASLYNDLGLTLSKLGQHDVAAQTLTRALQIAPGTSRYANNLASVHFESGNTDEAMKVLQANNKPAVAHFNMAFLHYKKGQVAQAQSQLNQSLAHEHEASSDPATKRAIDRSREMLVQISPAATTPASSPTSPIGAAPGPIATIAAAPAHRANQTPQVLGQAVMNPMQSQVKQPVVPGSMTPVSYQDPRSYMSPGMPTGTTPPSTGAPAQISVPQYGVPAATSTSTGASSAPAEAATPPNASGFSLPSGFNLPE